MNYHKPTAAILAAALAAPLTALAGPAIGFDPTGTGTYGTYADLWTNITDTAVVTGFIEGANVGGPGPGAIAPYVTQLETQARIGVMSNNGPINTPAGLNTTFELTKLIRFQETVTSQTATTATFGLAPQSAALDVDAARAGVQNFAVYFDQITPGGASQAVPGNGANTVRCYGAGVTGGAANGCGGGAGDPDGDGIMILSGHLVFHAASFTATGGVGTGSFDTRFVIDYVDPAYLDIVTGSVFLDKFTGTTNVPSFFTPTSMWDGATPTTVPLLKVDSSQSFAAVPEPGTVAIIGLGLAGLALSKRRKVNTPA
jgi:hypothetical protein